MQEKIYSDVTTRIFLIGFIVVLSYFALSILVQNFFIRQPQTMAEIMRYMMGGSRESLAVNILPLVIALGVGFLASIKLKTKPPGRIRTVNNRQRALSIVKKKLSDDEKNMLKEIERAGEITQDSLRARLGWSKAKVSTILTRLDKMNLIQRERQGKTYKVFLSKDLR